MIIAECWAGRHWQALLQSTEECTVSRAEMMPTPFREGAALIGGLRAYGSGRSNMERRALGSRVRSGMDVLEASLETGAPYSE